MLITGSAFSNIDVQLEESGLMITNLKSVIIKLILPIIKPALMSSFVLIFIFSISEFSVPSYFGVTVFTTEIFIQFSAFYNHSFAIIQSSFLILICVSLLYSERKYISDAPFLSINTKGSSIAIYKLNANANFINLTILVMSFAISVISPFTILIIQSFKGGISHFIHAFELLAPTFGDSLLLALVGAILIIIVGFSAAYYSIDQPKIKTTFNWLLLIIFAIPSIIYGISLIKFYNTHSLNFIYSSSIIILIAYVGKFSFISSKLIGNAIAQIPSSLSEAAKVQGISAITYLLRILIPLILPTLFVTFIISFILCIGELGTSIMIYPPGTEIMPIKVFTIMANAPQALTSSMVLIVLIISLLLITGFYFIAQPFLKKYIYIND
jgi:ABC-type Fe3+ transport system permease subunit